MEPIKLNGKTFGCEKCGKDSHYMTPSGNFCKKHKPKNWSGIEGGSITATGGAKIIMGDEEDTITFQTTDEDGIFIKNSVMKTKGTSIRVKK